MIKHVGELLRPPDQPGSVTVPSGVDPRLLASLDFSVRVFRVGISDLMKKDPRLLERRLNAGPGAEKERVHPQRLFSAEIQMEIGISIGTRNSKVV